VYFRGREYIFEAVSYSIFLENMRVLVEARRALQRPLECRK
jgi:hypothetical protein